MRLEAQTLELDALAVAEKAGQAEAEGLRAALAGAEMVRKNLEEGSQRELQEMQSLHQEQVKMGARECTSQRIAGSLGVGGWEQSHGILEGERGCFGLARAAVVLGSHVTWHHLKLSQVVFPSSLPGTLLGTLWREGEKRVWIPGKTERTLFSQDAHGFSLPSSR